MAPVSCASTRGSTASRQAPQSVARVTRASMAPTASEDQEACLTRRRSASYGCLAAARRGLEPGVLRPAAVVGVEVHAGRDDLVDAIEDVVAEPHIGRRELGLEV